jgi:hypothetical protein
LLEPPIESDTLPDDAEPALEADEATLSARAGTAQAATRVAAHIVREMSEMVIQVFRCRAE